MAGKEDVLGVLEGFACYFVTIAFAGPASGYLEGNQVEHADKD